MASTHSPFAFMAVSYTHLDVYKRQLLFRLVNYTQPETIVDAGTLAASALYLKAGKEGRLHLFS